MARQPKGPNKVADKAAAPAAPAATEKLDNQPVAPTTPRQLVQQSSQERVVLVIAGPDITNLIERLTLAGQAPGNAVTLGQLDESLLRSAAETVGVEGFDSLPTHELIVQIEAKLGGLVWVEAAPGAPANGAAGSEHSKGTTTADDADDGDVEGLWITAIPEQGFRRCGYRFTREGFGIALDALTAEQIEQLESEPNLKVERGIFGGRVGEYQE